MKKWDNKFGKIRTSEQMGYQAANEDLLMRFLIEFWCSRLQMWMKDRDE